MRSLFNFTLSPHNVRRSFRATRLFQEMAQMTAEASLITWMADKYVCEYEGGPYATFVYAAGPAQPQHVPQPCPGIRSDLLDRPHSVRTSFVVLHELGHLRQGLAGTDVYARSAWQLFRLELGASSFALKYLHSAKAKWLESMYLSRAFHLINALQAASPIWVRVPTLFAILGVTCFLSSVLVFALLKRGFVAGTVVGVLSTVFMILILRVYSAARYARGNSPRERFSRAAEDEGLRLATLGILFNKILRTVQRAGKQFERLPATYAGKREEDLRDHILISLESAFPGSATGETFSRIGKTDILMRKGSTNIFVAECKYWTGPKSLGKAMGQLLGYLTWRDSRAALVLFVQNKEMSRVLAEIESEVPKHPNCVAYCGKTDDSWYDYRFHVADDPGCEVDLAVLAFHTPPVTSC